MLVLVVGLLIAEWLAAQDDPVGIGAILAVFARLYGAAGCVSLFLSIWLGKKFGWKAGAAVFAFLAAIWQWVITSSRFAIG